MKMMAPCPGLGLPWSHAPFLDSDGVGARPQNSLTQAITLQRLADECSSCGTFMASPSKRAEGDREKRSSSTDEEGAEKKPLI